MEGIYSEKWPWLIFGCFFRAHSPSQLELTWLKKHLINLFDVDVETNHVRFQVKWLSRVEEWLKLLMCTSSDYVIESLHVLNTLIDMVAWLLLQNCSST